VLLIAEVS